MGRKVFISFLGTSPYAPCTYVKEDEGFVAREEMRYIQEATLDYLEAKEEWTEQDTALILITDLAQRKNWDRGFMPNPQNSSELILCQGLAERLANRKSKIKIEPLLGFDDLEPDNFGQSLMSNDQKVLWSYFGKLFRKIDESYQECDIYFDMTHSFRYFPMLFMVLLNYAKIMSNITIKSITYGNYEARDKSSNTAQIVDLLPIAELQDWTYAAANYLNNGRPEDLVSLSNKETRSELSFTKGENIAARSLQNFMEKLEDYTLTYQLCRGTVLYDKSTLNELFEKFKMIDSSSFTIPALEKVIDRVYNHLLSQQIHQEELSLIYASRWCYEKKLYQQAVTMLQEGIVTYVCKIKGIDLNIEADKQRTLVNDAFRLYYDLKIEEHNREKNIPKEKNKNRFRDIETPSLKCLLENLSRYYPPKKNKDEPDTDINMEILNKIKKILSTEIVQNMYSEFEQCRSIRNDINHAGFRPGPSKSGDLQDSIEKCVDSFISYFEGMNEI